MSFKKRIEDGLEGKYTGLNNGFKRVNKYIYGVQRSYYTLIGGLSGSAKTTVLDFQLLNALRDAESKKIQLDMFYYSYEIDETTKKANWMSNHVFTKYGIIIPPECIAGLGDNRMNEEQEKIVNAELPYIEGLFEKINFRFDVNNPIGIQKELMDHALANGEFIYETYKDKDGKEGRKIKGYTPNNPDAYTIIAMDHIALAQVLRGLTLKDNIDQISAMFIWFRNICGYTFFVVQQFNQTLNSVDRQKFKGVDLSPQQNDFKDSTNPYTDSDVAIGIMNPWKMDMQECMGYDLSIIKDKFRMYKIIKNRKGRDNLVFGLYFEAVAGSFKELPLPNELDKLKKVYEYIKKQQP
jgi:hypothetical protein